MAVGFVSAAFFVARLLLVWVLFVGV